MKEKGTVFSDHTHIIKVDGKTVYAEKEGQKIEFNNIDKIVVSTGMKTYVPFKNIGNIPVHIIGDAKIVGKAQDAIYDAYKLAVSL